MGNEFVMVPRELAEEINAALALHGYVSLPRALQVAMAKPAEQHQGEPVAWFRDGDEGREYCEKPFTTDWEPLYTHADPNVSWNAVADEQMQVIAGLRAQLAERDALLEDWHTANCTGEVNVSDKAYRIVTRTAAILSANATADLYERADILADAAYRNGVMHGYKLAMEGNEAEYQACINSLTGHLRAARAALSASAEPSAPTEDDYLPEGIVEAAIHGQIISLPSAPVERDERAEFDPLEWLETEISAVDTWYRGSPSYEHDAGWMKDQALRLVSEARAALERKPMPVPFTRQVGTLKLGIKGAAYDQSGTYRAYTYDEQPHNVEASKLGRAASVAKPGGDWIDYGLSLLKALQDQGFGVFDLKALEKKP